MKSVYLVLVSILLSSACIAQISVDSVMNRKRMELRKTGVDTTVSYYTYCVGSVQVYYEPTDSTCKANNTRYLLWSKGAQSFIQRFDECKQHSAVPISSSLMVMIKGNYPKLIKEKILPPKYTYMEKGKRVAVTTSRDHSCHTVFRVYAGTTSIQKDIDDYDLESIYLDGKHKNVNYLHNQRSLQNRLKVHIEELLNDTGIQR
jgi:hypothetical protein